MSSSKFFLGENAKKFATSPKFQKFDMVILNLDENTYISSPFVQIREHDVVVTDENEQQVVQDHGWEEGPLHGNGTFKFTYDPETSEWKYNGNAVELSEYGITITFAQDTPQAKDGDVIIVTRFADTTDTQNPQIELDIRLERSGQIMEANCPLVKPSERQGVADNILKRICGYGYQPFQASGAEVNPLMELGDGITSHGVYSGMFQQDLTFDQLMPSEIGAPAEEETESEFAYETASERKYSRKFAEIAAEFEITANEISARVEKEGTGEGFSWSLIESGFTIRSKGTDVLKVDAKGLHVTGDGTFTGDVTAATIKLGEKTFNNRIVGYNFDANSDGILKVGAVVDGNGNVTHNFKVDSGGVVSATDMVLSGTLTIGGQTITASALRNGAQSAYNNGSNWSSAYSWTNSNGSYCYTGSGYGYNYNDATRLNTTSYPSNFYTDILQVKTGGMWAGKGIRLNTVSLMRYPDGSECKLQYFQWYE